ncbi:cation:proton antiporter [Companilactobacillus kimchii]|uniref:NhaP-type Na H and K H antiporter n=2 Tax=Companilactobacillus kimchii TaxID=2801452 RepID=A0ABR5NQV6_9LACO|nr:sodium:proton antiporter [Companilactobacillus kimchii]GEO47824.1 sodium:proton antiporter [Companilactobacillus paralimentarius]KAE9559140.1 peptidase [Companilactobacillus kimchii]KAE9560922.1 peptidase [Companilactobacillus kimchii]KRK50098.1 NhaP-type Na H and K H antiporter [Companilactobacillus kimchii DSM 13961 = JCM 10707]OWF32257.1 putative Na(+)/H(+) exchanger [Companilactobacillus kimchii]
MEIIESIILILSLLIIANIVSHYFVSIPPSLLQIAAGILAALFMHVKIYVDTEWFLLAFIAPILFNDGNNFPKRELWKLKGPILGNAIILVILSTVIGGVFVKWLIPQLPWATAFTLVAVLSPTDPIAVESIAKKAHIPDKLMHLINGESLINDASGLICFKYGVAATVTGVFSLKSATMDFFHISIIGALVGAIMIWIFNGIRLYLINQGVDDSILHAIIQIIIPFIIYYVAEDVFDVSGVVAVVIAGILNISSGRNISNFTPEIRLVTSRTWDLVVYVLNGIVFVLLGIEIPFAMEELVHNDNINTFGATLMAFVIWIMLVVIRFLWSYIYSTFSNNGDGKIILWSKTRFDDCLMSGISGVRGAVTMVGALSIPMTIKGGAAFPSRTLLLFIASAVIIFSLLGATLLIPILTKNSAPVAYRGSTLTSENDDDENDEDVDESPIELTEYEANRVILEKTVKKLRSEMDDGDTAVYSSVIAEYLYDVRNLGIQSRNQVKTSQISKRRVRSKKDAELWDISFNCELEAVDELYDNHEISDESYDLAIKKIARYKREIVHRRSNQTVEFFYNYFRRTYLQIKHLIYRSVNSDDIQQINQDSIKISIAGAKNALKKLQELNQSDSDGIDDDLIYIFQRHYEDRLELLQGKYRGRSPQFNSERMNLEIKALSYRRAFVQDMLEQGKISKITANELRKNINYSEEVISIGVD